MTLYALCDIATLYKKNLSIENFINISKKYNAKILQYRDKSGSFEEKQSNLLLIRSMFDGMVIINDDISLVDYCDGLHIGQEDILRFAPNKKDAIRVIRDKIGSKLLGLSTHNESEILEANELDLDYIGLGAYRDTSTKDVSNTLGDSASYLASKSKHQVALIGGVRLDDRVKNITYSVICSGLV
jgi:thiamine-phosphate pyrophosphorylase